MDADRCVMCGDIIPEGIQVCPICDGKFNDSKMNDSYDYINIPINMSMAADSCNNKQNGRDRFWKRRKERKRK